MDPKTYLVLLHLVGLVVGLGSVTTLDIYLLKFLRGDTVTRSDAHLVDLVSKLAAVGLACLWVSGIGFLAMLWMNSPELLGNPKIHAKMIIVGILTINGAFLHFKVLPLVERAVGRPLFCKSGDRSDRIWMRVCGAVSAASWWTPFFLGTVRELNFAAPIWVFLGAYAILLAVFGAGFTVVEDYLGRRFGHKAVHDHSVPVVGPQAPAFPVAAFHADLIDDRVPPKNEDTRRVMREEKTFGSNGGDSHRDLDSRIRERRIRALRRRLTGADGDADDDADSAAPR